MEHCRTTPHHFLPELIRNKPKFVKIHSPHALTLLLLPTSITKESTTVALPCIALYNIFSKRLGPFLLECVLWCDSRHCNYLRRFPTLTLLMKGPFVEMVILFVGLGLPHDSNMALHIIQKCLQIRVADFSIKLHSCSINKHLKLFP